MNSTTVILPAYNEEATVGKVIDEIREVMPEVNIVVIDNASTDNTGPIALSKGASIVLEPRKGKGRAVRTAIEKLDSAYILMLNSDYTYPAQYLATVFQVLSKSGADVVMGYRHIKEKGSMSTINSFGNWVLSRIAGLFHGVAVFDVCTGMWGFRREVLEKFYLTSNGFTLEADLYANAVRNRCRLEQIPIAYRARLDGSIAKLKVRDGFKIGWFLIKESFR